MQQEPDHKIERVLFGTVLRDYATSALGSVRVWDSVVGGVARPGPKTEHKSLLSRASLCIVDEMHGFVGQNV